MSIIQTHFFLKEATHNLYTNIPLNNIGKKTFRAMSHAGKGPMLFVLQSRAFENQFDLS